MNLEQIRNPHLIYPGPGAVPRQDRRPRAPAHGRTRRRPRRAGQAVAAGALEPAATALASIPFHLIEPFLNEAVIFESNELAAAPRIVATQEGRVMLVARRHGLRARRTRPERDYRIFREPRPLRDPTTKEILGYEAVYVGTAEYTRAKARPRTNADGKAEIVPGHLHAHQRPRGGRRRRPPRAGAAARIHQLRAARAGHADRRARSSRSTATALTAGQNQIVALNRGAVDGIERGHVLAL